MCFLQTTSINSRTEYIFSNLPFGSEVFDGVELNEDAPHLFGST